MICGYLLNWRKLFSGRKCLMELEAELLFTKKSTDKPSYTMQPYGVPSVRKGDFEHRMVAIRDARKCGACTGA